MAIYTVGRRQVIVALLLTAALLLTLDLRGNPILDTIRDGFSRAMAPVETATEVVARPMERAWNSYSNYDDLERENELLREVIAQQAGNDAAARASVIDYQLLLALNNLPSLSGIETEKAQVVGVASNNIDQVVEINKGSDQGIAVGMPVVNQAGLIGKITQVNATTAKVMLVTDPRYAVAVEILAGTGEGLGDLPVTENTTPSGATPEELDAIEEAAGTTSTTAPDADGAVTSTTTPLDVFGDEFPLAETDDQTPTTTTTIAPDDEDESVDAPPVTDPDGEPVPTTTLPVTTTTEPIQLEKEFGTLGGRGAGRPPQISFIQNAPSLAVLEVGDLVETAGGGDSLAPPNIPVGRVINRADRPGVAGPLLEIELTADLDSLNFVRVVLFRPLSEVEQ